MQRIAVGAHRRSVDRDFEALVRDELPGLLRYATVLCGEREQAADLVQDVLVRAYERWDRIRRTERPAAYLTRMVTNEFLSWRRRWSTRRIVLTDADDLARTAGSTADHGEQVVVRDDLERRLRALPARQQAALVLRFYEGLDHAEIAIALGCAQGSARSAVSRGLTALRLSEPTVSPTSQLSFQEMP